MSFPRSTWTVVLRFFVKALFGFVFLFGHTGPAYGRSASSLDLFAALKTRLILDGFDRSLIQSLYARPEMAFDEQGVSTYFLHREAALNYDQFLTQSSIDQTLDYLSAHRETLDKAQADYGVEPEIVCAIILVETRLGKLIGSRLVINTLSTLAALSDREPRETIWRENLKERATGSQKEFEIWASRRSAWAYRELKAYLQYVTTQGLEPFSIRGSFAGALGIAQFIPSSVLEYAKDGNQDGKINLFDHEDAIESIAYYLNRHGWRPSLARQKASDVLLSYNQSQYYVETILEVAERLGKGRSR